jgi:hypothetical protein
MIPITMLLLSYAADSIWFIFRTVAIVLESVFICLLVFFKVLEF